MVLFSRADNWRCYPRFAKHPREPYLRLRNALLFSDFGDRIDHFDIRLPGLLVEHFAELIGFRSVGVHVVSRWTGQLAARERAPGNDADPLIDAQRDHLTLFFAVEQIVVIL